MGQHAPHRVLEVACSRRRSQQKVSMIELLKGSRITSSPSAAGTGPQGICQGGAHGSPRACRKAGTTGPGTYAISGGRYL
jgi:hypothetical protein